MKMSSFAWTNKKWIAINCFRSHNRVKEIQILAQRTRPFAFQGLMFFFFFRVFDQWIMWRSYNWVTIKIEDLKKGLALSSTLFFSTLPFITGDLPVQQQLSCCNCLLWKSSSQNLVVPVKSCELLHKWPFFNDFPFMSLKCHYTLIPN